MADLALIPLAGAVALLSALAIPLLVLVTLYAVAATGSVLSWWVGALGFAGITLCIVNAAAVMEVMHRPNWPAMGWMGVRTGLWLLLVIATFDLSGGSWDGF
ncbi:MAG: hypothetical protein ACRYFW_16035 [Janthinobacterium lividum]